MKSQRGIGLLSIFLAGKPSKHHGNVPGYVVKCRCNTNSGAGYLRSTLQSTVTLINCVSRRSNCITRHKCEHRPLVQFCVVSGNYRNTLSRDCLYRLIKFVWRLLSLKHYTGVITCHVYRESLTRKDSKVSF